MAATFTTNKQSLSSRMAFSHALRTASRLCSYTVLGACGGALLKNHVADITPINGKSMNPTLSPDVHETGRRDYIIWKMWNPLSDLKRGDLVLFMSPKDPETVVVKRVIAMSGDEVRLDIKRQPGFGLSMDELRAEDVAAAQRWSSWNGKLTVPYGHIWVEGDNWRASRDSNDYGPISKSLVIGKAWMGVWPSNIFFAKPWEGYRIKTKVREGQDIRPRFWSD